MTKVLIAAPFPPDRSGFHGGTQAIGRLIEDLAPTHSLAVAYLRAPGEPPLEPALARLCEHVEEVARPASGWLRDFRLAGALARGYPMWVEDWHVPLFGERLRELAGRWRPDVVQFEFHTMAQYASAVSGLVTPTVLVIHEPGAAAAEDRYHSSRGWRNLVLKRDQYSWNRYERDRLTEFERLVCFTPLDRNRLLKLQPAARIVVIPPCGLRPRESPSPGSETDTVLFIGSYKHPPNVMWMPPGVCCGRFSRASGSGTRRGFSNWRAMRHQRTSCAALVLMSRFPGECQTSHRGFVTLRWLSRRCKRAEGSGSR